MSGQLQFATVEISHIVFEESGVRNALLFVPKTKSEQYFRKNSICLNYQTLENDSEGRLLLTHK